MMLLSLMVVFLVFYTTTAMVCKAPATLAGVGGSPGDVSITGDGGDNCYTLMCGNGLLVEYGGLGGSSSGYVTKYGIENCNQQAIWVVANGGQVLCKGLTDYQTSYKPIRFFVNAGTGQCSLNTPLQPSPTRSPFPTPVTGRRVLGGWVGDDAWTTPLPYYMNLDFLDIGYITCIHNLRNGPCASPGQRSAADGPPSALANAATNLLYVLGGDGCNPAGWDAASEVNANSGWDGIDIDNECNMSPDDIGSSIASFTKAGKSSIVSYLCEEGVDLSWLGSLRSAPTYYVSLTFGATEFCSLDSANYVPGCIDAIIGYENHIPSVITRTLTAIGQANSQKMILGLHAKGINAATVSFWCNQVHDNNLGGIFISFIHDLDQSLYQQLKTCLGR